MNDAHGEKLAAMSAAEPIPIRSEVMSRLVINTQVRAIRGGSKISHVFCIEVLFGIKTLIMKLSIYKVRSQQKKIDDLREK